MFLTLVYCLKCVRNAGFDPATFRVDPYGNVLYYHADSASPLAWDIDHWFPCSSNHLLLHICSRSFINCSCLTTCENIVMNIMILLLYTKPCSRGFKVILWALLVFLYLLLEPYQFELSTCESSVTNYST